MIYADSSFLVSLLSADLGTSKAKDVMRSLSRPILCFGDLHQMEVRNTLRAIQFIETTNSPANRHAEILQNRLRSEARLARLVAAKALRPTTLDAAEMVSQFESLSAAHTAELGTRTLDILHVAAACLIQPEEFITTDARQAALAKRAGLNVRLVEIP